MRKRSHSQQQHVILATTATCSFTTLRPKVCLFPACNDHRNKLLQLVSAGLTVKRIRRHQNPQRRCLLHRFGPHLLHRRGRQCVSARNASYAAAPVKKSLEFHPLWLRQVVSTHSARRTKQQGRALRARPLFN